MTSLYYLKSKWNFDPLTGTTEYFFVLPPTYSKYYTGLVESSKEIFYGIGSTKLIEYPSIIISQSE